MDVPLDIGTSIPEDRLGSSGPRGRCDIKLSGMFQRFAEKAPMPVMARLVLERALAPTKLDAWFERTAPRQYTRELLFSSVIDVMSLVAFKVFPTVHAAYQERRDEIGVSVTSLYNKINCVDPQTSRALVRDTAAEMAADIVKMKGTRQPWLPGYRVKILDGNCLAATEHRLEELRKTPAGPLPGKSLVVYDPSLEMVVDSFPCEDGHAQERSLLPDVVPTVQARDLWIMDRNFCTREFLEGIEDKHGTFICRLHRGLTFAAEGIERRVGSCETGVVYEKWVDVTPFFKDGKTRRYRLIRVELKEETRDGEKELFLLTDLSKSAANAKRIAQMYRRRWEIETMFQELEAHLHSEVTTLGYPKAALFAFSIAVVAYNALAVIKAALRRIHGEEAIDQGMSGYYVATALTRDYSGMMVALPPKSWSRFRTSSHKEYLDLLSSIAAGVDLSRYRKNKRGPKKPRPPRTKFAKETHVSTARLLWERER